MSNEFLHRGDAPFSDEVWEKIDEAVVTAAKSQLSARRILHVDGPHGLGLKTVSLAEIGVQEKGAGEEVKLTTSVALPLVGIQVGFSLAARDIAAYQSTRAPLDLGPAAAAALSCARQEDSLIFNGSKAVAVRGISSTNGTQSLKLSTWEKVGAAAEDVIKAATKLDDSGFHGPYALALSPARYNLLFRRYPQGSATEIEHLRVLLTGGIVKAPAIPEGGLLLATGRQYATIVLGQDILTAFLGPSLGGYDFLVRETLTPRLIEPSAFCLLK